MAKTPEESTFNILLATDIHLGYGEKDPVRGDDSFTAFEEVLKLAKHHDVDFILLAGDLFHDSRPSQKCMYRCMKLLRRYCLGPRNTTVEFLSDQSLNFKHCAEPVVNYEDPNLNIAIPIYSIHGNHDDPVGNSGVCSLDILSASGFINYFGKSLDLVSVNVLPILLKKGCTQLAIYGLSHIKDERLARLYREQHVNMFRPRENQDDWFNMFLLHQNRVNRNQNNHVTEELLPDYLDLVVWGHEHECRITPEWNDSQSFFVTQPGSTVATSLCEAEAGDKHVALLKIHKRGFVLDPIKLKTVRPLMFDTLVLSKTDLKMEEVQPEKSVQQFVLDHVSNMIKAAKDRLSGDPLQPTLPIVRLRVEYSSEDQVFNPSKLSSHLVGHVANPGDVVLLRKERVEKNTASSAKLDREMMDELLQGEKSESRWYCRVERVVEKYFTQQEAEHYLQVLSVNVMAEGVRRYIDNEEDDALPRVLTHQRDALIKHLKAADTNGDRRKIETEIQHWRELRQSQEADQVKDVQQFLETTSKKGMQSLSSTTAEVTIIDSGSSDDEFGISINRRSSTTVGTSRGATKKKVPSFAEETVLVGARGGHGRGRAAARRPRAARGGRGRGSSVQPSIQSAFSNSTASRQSRRTFKGLSFQESDSE